MKKLRIVLLVASWLVCIIIGYFCRGSAPVFVPVYAGTELTVLNGVPQLPKGFNGTLKEDYPDGRTKSIQVIGDGVGTCTVNFEPDGRIGKLQTSVILPSGLLVVKTIEWRDGSVAWEGSMAFDKENRKSVWVGVHRGWHPNGVCGFEKTLNSYGQEIKTSRTWFPNGQLHLEHVFDDNGGFWLRGSGMSRASYSMRPRETRSP